MELVDLSLIKPMLMRSLSNPEAIKIFINDILLGKILGTTIGIIIFVLAIHYIYSLLYSLIKSRKKEKENEKEKKESHTSYFKELLREKFKKNLHKYRYLLIGLLLIALSRLLISLLFRLTNTGGISCKFSPEENYLLGLRATYSLCIFIIASMLIMFSFGNKFVRNLGILTFIICICFILTGKLISLGCAGM